MNRLNGIIFYTGFNEPELLAESFRDLVSEVVIESNYNGNVTNEFLEVLTDELHFIGLSIDTPLNELSAEQCDVLNAELSDYGIYTRPTLTELQDYNESVMLDRSRFLESFIGGVA
ncbi:hypothetical protein [Mammaliicoccus sciuri]|uniref:hypothetical protein n=1 Tax=Mammaliicoccus sciuri TaxID=1296 RepID=UPI000D1F2F6D|nr:hypothetical protein [Mammaliicoccus sciuri]PTJ54201.1 hypothetical protein BU012_00975 [Mammaliicoccus sciuri]